MAIDIQDAKRIVKRILLSNLIADKSIYLTPLLSGPHGIGKSTVIHEIATELHGVAITVDGGQLKEGEITGLPYQYSDKDGNVSFRFLPHYSVKRIQEREKRIYLKSHPDRDSHLFQDIHNPYARNNLSADEKIKKILSGEITPVIFFLDEINRTERGVYKELRNLLLNRSINGYVFPWWVFFVGARNPSTSSSYYQTIDRDPAQLDRFIKIDVKTNSSSFLNYGQEHNLSPVLLEYIKDNKKNLTSNDDKGEEEVLPSPSPRGYDRLDTIRKSFSKLTPFFSDKENDIRKINKDFEVICKAKLGKVVGEDFFQYYRKHNFDVSVDDVLKDDKDLDLTLGLIKLNDREKRKELARQLIRYRQRQPNSIGQNWKWLSEFENKLSLLLKNLNKTSQIEFARAFRKTKNINGLSLSSIYHDIYIHLILPIDKESNNLFTLFDQQK